MAAEDAEVEGEERACGTFMARLDRGLVAVVIVVVDLDGRHGPRRRRT
jgi:hypothetical protein